jgi:hypothetical protein
VFDCPDITSDNQGVYDGAYADGAASVDITSDNLGLFDAGVASVECPDGENSCPGDLDNDGAVSTYDLILFLAAFGDACE